jgi:hypothetical protein
MGMAWRTFQKVVAVALVSQLHLPAQTEEPEWFFYAVKLDLRTLQDTLPTIPSGGSCLVPFGELCRTLKLGIQTDPEKGLAEGFFISEKRRFRLDLATGIVEIEGQKRSFDTTRILRRSEDIYIDIRLIEEWLPIAFGVDVREAAITVKPMEQLPIQAQWEREDRLARMSQMQRKADHPDATPVTTPYAFLDVPMIDQTLAVSHQPEGRHSIDYSGSTYLSGDLFWMSSSIFFNLQPDGKLGNFRGTLFREDPQGKLLGPLHAHEVSLGDLTLPTVDFLGSGPKGRGLLVSSYPTNFRSQFDVRTFRGNLAPGWSVELIQNGYILGYQNARLDGLYEFLNVPLRFGLNDFRLVFHGPQGQRREESYRLDLSDSLVPAGESYYRVAGLRPLTTNDPTSRQSPLFRVESDYGLTKSLSLNGAVSQQSQPNGPTAFALAGMRLALPFLSLRASKASDENGQQHATLVDFKTGYGYTSLDVGREEYSKWKGPGASSVSTEDSPLCSRTHMSFNGSWKINRVGVQAGVSSTEERYQNHDSQRQLSLDTAVGYRSWSIGNTLTRKTQQGVQSEPAAVEGNLHVSREDDQYSLRAEGDYERLSGALKFTRGQSTLEYRPSEDTNWQLIMIRRIMEKQTQVQLAFNKLKGKVGLGIQGMYSRDAGFSVTTTLQVSFAREPRTRKWAIESMPLAGQGAISAVAFIDGNGNGRMDDKETPIEKSEFLVNGSKGTKLIEHDTVGFVGPVGRGTESYATVDTLSLEDPFVKPSGKPFAFIPRPGKTVRLDVPLVAFGEITGTAYLKTIKGTRELPGLELELLRLDGSTAMRQQTAFDGFFDFTGIPPGDYTLRVSPASAERLHLKTPTPRPLKILPSGTAMDGFNLLLAPLEASDIPVGTTSPLSIPSSIQPSMPTHPEVTPLIERHP